MAEAPSPYAPGIIADEPVPARAAGRPIVFLVAAFAMAVVYLGDLWLVWLARAVGESGAPLKALYSVYPVGIAITAPTLLWAYLTDVLPLLGTRREGYLLLTGIMSAVAWGVLVVASDQLFILYGTAALLGVAIGVTRAVVLGGLAEIGQRREISGQLAAAYLGVTQIGLLAGWVVTRPLGLMSRAWTAGLGAALGLSLVVVVVTLADERQPSPAVLPAARISVPRLLRSRAFWVSFAVLFFGGLATVPASIIALAHARLTHTPYQDPHAQWSSGVIALAAAALYAIACRFLRLRALLRLSLAAKAGALMLIASAVSPMTEAALQTTEIYRAGGEGLADVAFLHLAMRVAPPGREAFGTVLLVGVPYMVTTAMKSLARRIDSPGHLPLIAAGVAVLAALLVSLLPREVS